MLKRGTRIAFVALVGCVIAFGSARPPAEGADPSRPATKQQTPSETSNPQGCAQFCKTEPIKSCDPAKRCQNVEANVLANGICECLCRDRCDGGRQPNPKR